MKIFKQLSIIFALCIFGNIISSYLPIPFPGSVIAMIFMFLLLMFKVIKTDDVKEVSEFLTSTLAAYFISTTVSIVQYADILKNIIFRFLIVCILSAIITFGITAIVVSALIKLKERREQNAE